MPMRSSAYCTMCTEIKCTHASRRHLQAASSRSDLRASCSLKPHTRLRFGSGSGLCRLHVSIFILCKLIHTYIVCSPSHGRGPSGNVRPDSTMYLSSEVFHNSVRFVILHLRWFILLTVHGTHENSNWARYIRRATLTVSFWRRIRTHRSTILLQANNHPA
jgi:hypothetical protein